MKEPTTEIEYKGEKYNLVFNFNVMEEIQAECGSIDKWFEKLNPKKNEIDIKAFKFGFAAMINEGIDIYNSENPKTTKPFFTLKQVGHIMTELGMLDGQFKALNAVNAAIEKSMQSAEKNA